MKMHHISSVGWLVVLVVCSQSAFGQRGGMSAFGGGGMGSSAFGSGGFGSGGFGGSGMGMGNNRMGGGFGSSGFGNSGFGNRGNSGFGNSGFGNSGFGNAGFGNSGFGTSGFGGGQQFVGRDSMDMQSTFQQTTRAQTQFFNNMNRQFNRQNRDRRQSTTTQNPPQPMRMEVRVAFETSGPTSQVVGNTLRARLAKILPSRGMSQPVVIMEGDTAVLKGVAASESERQVIGQLVAMEQGVRGVRNEMTVAGVTGGSRSSP